MQNVKDKGKATKFPRKKSKDGKQLNNDRSFVFLGINFQILFSFRGIQDFFKGFYNNCNFNCVVMVISCLFIFSTVLMIEDIWPFR